LSIVTIVDRKKEQKPMTSMSDFAGQSLIWVRGAPGWNLIAPDNSVIATFPVERKGWAVGVAGRRWKKAKAIVPDGTGALFLNEEGQRPNWHIAIYADEQGLPLAIYEEPWLVFPDGRRLIWGRIDFFSALVELRRYGTMSYGGGGWADPTGPTTYVEFRDGMRKKRVIIYPRAAEIRDPELSLLVVLGLYNMYVENIKGMLESAPKGPLPGIE
jgi:hypothetical protein